VRDLLELLFGSGVVGVLVWKLHVSNSNAFPKGN
jgi:hypothetical protein